jgi:hypothetical protein
MPAEGSFLALIATKHTTAWAYSALGCSLLGWLAAAPLPLIDYNHLIGGTAGVGVIGPFLLGLLSALLCLLGIIFGIVALARTRDTTFHGRGKAWTGIALGGLLLTAYLVAGHFLLGLW